MAGGAVTGWPKWHQPEGAQEHSTLEVARVRDLGHPQPQVWGQGQEAPTLAEIRQFGSAPGPRCRVRFAQEVLVNSSLGCSCAHEPVYACVWFI